MRCADGPPLDPSSGQAHDWLVEELRTSAYLDQRSIFDRLADWLNRQLTRGDMPAGHSEFIWLALLGVIIAIIALIVWQMRREPATLSERDDGGVLGGTERAAEQHRELARAASSRGDWNGAVIEGFRALARAATERTILPDSPGLTAREVAAALATPFPDEGRELSRAAAAFDAVRYGDDHADAREAEQILALDARLLAARPRRTGDMALAGSDEGAP